MPGRGQYWKKGGLIDETVKEEDLSQALQNKVNAVDNAGYDEVLDEGVSLPKRIRLDFVGDGVTATDGTENTTTVTIAGGGGGGTQFPDGVPFTRGLLYDDFNYFGLASSETPITNKYEVLGTGTLQTNNGFLGTIGIEGDGVSGNGKLISSGDDWEIKVNVNSETQWRIQLQQTANIIVFAGLADAPADFSATIATAEAGIGDGAWFRYSASDSANWQAVTKDAGGTNVIDTGVSATTSFITMEIRLNGTQATFFINGSQVAQTPTNYPDNPVRIFSETINQGATFRSHFLDAWHCLADR